MRSSRKKLPSISFRCFLAFFVFICGAGLVEQAVAAQGVTFQWKRGQETDILGYRLYYGNHSRLGTSARSDQYSEFLDLASWERCSTDTYRPACETIRPDEVTCSNLEGIRPRCTIQGLPGGLTYFAVTAYSQDNESDFSVELSARLDSNGNLIQNTPYSPPNNGNIPHNVGHLPGVFKALFN